MTILKVGACRSFHRVVGAREGHDVRLGGCWGVVGGVLGGCWGAVGCMLGGPGGGLNGGSSQQMRFRGKGVEYDGLSCGCNRKITAS